MSDPSTSSPTTTEAPINGSLAFIEPPDLTMPVLPNGFVPANLDDFRGSRPKAGQITALPGAIAELDSQTSYVQTFGGGVPSASKLAMDLGIASGWTTLRVSMERYLVYVKSNEAITWKEARAEVEQLNAVFQVVAKQNPALTAELPATARLLAVPRVIGERGAATRARNAKAKAKPPAESTAATPAPGANAAPLVIPTTAANGSGGVTH